MGKSSNPSRKDGDGSWRKKRCSEDYMILIAWFAVFANIYLCITQIRRALRERSLSAFVWVFLCYFAVLSPFELILRSPFLEGYSGYERVFEDADYLRAMAFMFSANVCLALGYSLGGEGPGERLSNYAVSSRNHFYRMAMPLLLAAYVAGFFLFFKTAGGMGYTEFVEYQGSNWGLVLVYLSSPAICLLSMRKRYGLAAVMALPYVYFSVVLQVRSFFVFSLLPIVVIYYLDNKPASLGLTLSRRGIGFFAVLVGLLLANFVVTQNKTGQISLPEQQLLRNFIQVSARIAEDGGFTGFDSTIRLLYGVIAPLGAIFNYQPALPDDVQVYFARLIFGASTLSGYFHYPSLWYADAYASFGWLGALVGLAIGGWLRVAEKAISFSKISFSLFLPFYIWNVYMILRGAMGNSVAAISYPLYMAALLYLLLIIALLVRGPISRAKIIEAQNR